ncbi:MAG TPA: bifunctional 4-hydroxy-2-oxoglutarate aldolase/2-dehydro-3-deoxy-phosphogluconate aldolase [Gemmatimonadaceae bacterium]|nr:bifunctional 4-hydroxy-2-oxoglutarate aldolase/2-dehydro-3-deoxy-phosphogluconate aldolase [Gemmatimonadaceae bacterium]
MTTANSTADSTREILGRVGAVRIVPVIVIDDAADAVPLAAALTEGGLSCAEITFRTAAAPEALRRITAEYPGMLAGAGTVLTPRQAQEARAAGAQFIVAPGFGPAVVDYCLEHEIPVYPGVCTPTEIEMALGKGLDVLKFFPAEPIGGLGYLKAIAAPYPTTRFIPTGGINLGSVSRYLAWDRVVACGGSWMAPMEWIASRQFERIRDEARRATALARELTTGTTLGAE